MSALSQLGSPMAFRRALWPHVRFYKKQRDIIESVDLNDETFVTAGNQLGKDFVAAFIALRYFLMFKEPTRVVTTSVRDDHLRVLWGEIGRFINESRVPLDYKKGGILICNFRDIRRIDPKTGDVCPISYLRGMVSEKGEGMAGHHAPRTLAVLDEACHDQETEVLTDEGWKHFRDLSGSEMLLTMNPATRIAEYQRPIRYYRSYRSGPMYLYERRCGNFCVTPNHRMLWSRYRGNCKEPWSEYYLQTIEEINGANRAIPRCFNWLGREQKTYTVFHSLYGHCAKMDAWLEFLGWFVAEGCFRYNRGELAGITLTQKNKTILEKLQVFLRSIGLNPSLRDCRPINDCYCLLVYSRSFAEELLRLCNGRYSWEKKAPRFIFDLPPRQIEVFLQAIREGDGYTHGKRDIVYTSSPKLANDIQILSYLAGREATLHKRSLIGLPAPNGFSRRDGYVISRSGAGLDSHLKVKRQYLQKVDYAGEVFCAQVPKWHTLFTRRSGVCMWSGNSGIEDVVYDMVIGWAKRLLVFGNPNNCENFFFRGIEGGDILEGHKPNESTSDLQMDFTGEEV